MRGGKQFEGQGLGASERPPVSASEIAITIGTLKALRTGGYRKKRLKLRFNGWCIPRYVTADLS